MKEILSPSLLPYLQADGNRFRLEISLISGANAYIEKSPYPFLLIDDSTPFERLLQAKFVTGTGSEIRRVFILQQSDRYRHVVDEMWPVTNLDIDRRWATVLDRFFSESKADPRAPLVLSDPIPQSGEFLPFQPLFYCCFRNVYFHPPCPECGNPLDLCRNDQLLTESGLAGYSTSLRRYLYCLSCCRDSDHSRFYTYSRHADEPSTVTDRWELIHDFGNLMLRSASPDGFPCSGCPELSACFGSDDRARSRIVPFSFYPFHMLIFEADTLSARDFLALLSGASADAIQAKLPGEKTGGRHYCLGRYQQLQGLPSEALFSGQDDKRFLEILYLKLSFLGELIGLLYADSRQGVYCDTALSLDRVWVKLGAQAGQLPQFWNFSLSVIDLWSDTIRQPHLSKYPPAYGHHFLGNIWFYALLVNQDQSMEAVRAELDRQISAFSDAVDKASEIIAIDVGEAVFAPQNIFWSPESKPAAEGSLVFWKRALALGSDVLAAGLQSAPNWSLDRFLKQFNDLRSDIKAALFEPEPLSAENSTGNQAIHKILNRLLEKWRQEQIPARPPESSEDADTIIMNDRQPTGDLTQTLVRSPGAEPQVPPSAVDQTDEEETLILKPDPELQPPDIEIEPEKTADDALAETVILSPENKFKPTGTAGSNLNEEPLQETVILSPKSKPNPPRSNSVPSDEGIIQETVILSPGNSAPHRALADGPSGDSDEAGLAQTVVLSPGGQRPARFESADAETTHGNHSMKSRQGDRKDIRLKIGVKKGRDASPDDDILTETVILRPQKKKGS